MSKKDDIANVVKKYCYELGKGCDGWICYSYANFPEKERSKLLRFDKNLFVDDMAAFFCVPDCLRIQLTCHNDYGFLFMLSGFYARPSDQLKGFSFIKYSSISRMEVLKEKELKIYLKDSMSDFFKTSELSFSNEVNAEPLKSILEKIIQIDRADDTSYTTESETGRVSGLSGKGNRQMYYKGQISGYKRASREYEIKLRKQADAFLAQRNKWKSEREEYEALLDEYEKTIMELQTCINQSYSDEYQPILNDVVRYRNKLARLSA